MDRNAATLTTPSRRRRFSPQTLLVALTSGTAIVAAVACGPQAPVASEADAGAPRLITSCRHGPRRCPGDGTLSTKRPF